jgi:hypothetical protein
MMMGGWFEEEELNAETQRAQRRREEELGGSIVRTRPYKPKGGTLKFIQEITSSLRN